MIDQNYVEAYDGGADWMETHTGLKFFPARPRIGDINIFDIAHALSLKCRYGGHCKAFYSVAEHTVTMAFYARYLGLPVETQFQLLMHEGGEAYLPDVPRPIKHYFPLLVEMEKAIDAMVRFKWGLRDNLPAEVKEFDSRIIHDERRQVMLPSGNNWQTDLLKPLGVQINGLTPMEAKVRFLSAFQLIGQEHLGRHVLLCYDEGEFQTASGGDLNATDRAKVPDIRMIDVLGKCALARTPDGNGQYYLHGDFALS